MDKVLLIDGFNFIWRADIKFKSFNSKNTTYKYTTVYNFFRNLRALIEEFDPDKVFFVLEGKSNFRYSLFSDYKANRKIIKTSSSESATNTFIEQRDRIIEL